MFFSGLGRLTNVAIDTYKLYTTIMTSGDWKLVRQRMSQIEFQAMMMRAFKAYADYQMYSAQGEFKVAGQAVSHALFPQKFSASESELDFYKLPYAVAYDGDELSGVFAGVIYSFTGEENQDGLALCVSDQDTLRKEVNEAVQSLNNRYDADVLAFISKLVNMFLFKLGDNVENCSDETKEQVAAIQSKIAGLNLEDDAVLSNLTANKNHIQLMMAKMQMQYQIRDYMEYGYSLGDVFQSLATI